MIAIFAPKVIGTVLGVASVVAMGYIGWRNREKIAAQIMKWKMKGIAHYNEDAVGTEEEKEAVTNSLLQVAVQEMMSRTNDLERQISDLRSTISSDGGAVYEVRKAMRDYDDIMDEIVEFMQIMRNHSTDYKNAFKKAQNKAQNGGPQPGKDAA